MRMLSNSMADLKSKQLRLREKKTRKRIPYQRKYLSLKELPLVRECPFATKCTDGK